MTTQRKILWICAVAAFLFSAPAAIAASPSYERGVEAANNYRYSEALMHFTTAAKRGDWEAQRNLGLMLLYGDLLYGRDVSRNREQARRWLQAASNQGCEVSAFVLKVIATHGR